MVGEHRRFSGDELGQTLGDSEGQGGLASMGLQRVGHNLTTEQRLLKLKRRVVLTDSHCYIQNS